MSHQRQGSSGRAVLLPLVVLACLVGSGSVRAGEVGWSMASKSDADLVRLARELEAEPSAKVDAAVLDADAVGLTLETILELESSSFRVTENAMYRVLNAEDSQVGTRQFRFSARSRIQDARAWIIRGDKVIRCPAAAATVVKGSGDRPAELLIAIPGIVDGDIIGWSYTRAADWAYPGATIMLQGEEPTRRHTLRLLTDGLVAYRIMGRNLDPGTFEVNVLERKNGTETHTLAEFHDLVEQADGPYAPPALASAPCVSISWRGYLYTYGGFWYFLASWNEAAVWMQDVLDDMLQANDEVREKAHELVAGLAGDKEKFAALHDFVRTEIVRLESWESGDDGRRAGEVLASRTASSFEAGALLCAMARSVDLPVRPVFARSLDLGPLDNGNPGLHQFSDLLVEYLAEPGCYAAPARRNCPLGTLPDDLVGGTAMVLADDLAAKEREALGKMFSSNDKDAQIMVRYHDYVARLEWQSMFTLPGNAAAVRGTLVETVKAVAGCDTASVSVVGTGRDGFLSEAAATEDAVDLLAQYCEGHLPNAKVVSAAPRVGGGPLDGAVSIDLGQPSGDTWLIPSESVFGAPFMAGLGLPVVGPFHVAVTRDIKRECHVRIPAGWRLATTPPSLNAACPAFVVSARLGVMNNELVIIREMRLRRGTTAKSGLAALEDAVGRVRAFEQTPLLLVRDAAPAARP